MAHVEVVDSEAVARLHAAAWALGETDPTRALALAEEAEEMALALGDVVALAHSRLALGRCRRLGAHYEAARESLTSALAAFEAMGNLGGEARCLNELVAVHFETGEPAQGLERCVRALDLARGLGDKALTAECLSNLGVLHADLDDHAAALERQLEALRLREALGDRRGQAQSLARLGIINALLGRHEECLRYQLEGLAAAEALGNAWWVGAGLINVGLSLHHVGRFTEAMAYHNRALAAARSTGDRSSAAHALENSAVTLEELGRLEEALALHREALELRRASGEAQQARESLLMVGLVLTKTDARAALDPLREALAPDETALPKDFASRVHEALAAAYERGGDPWQALAHHRRFHDLEKEVRGEAVTRKVQALFAGREIELARREAERERERSEVLERANAALREANREKGELLRRLEEQATALAHQARHDALTGLCNRGAFETLAAGALERARALGEPLSVAIADIDSFKAINDRFSHAVGDEVLRAVARLLKAACRATDTAARYGGEEFVLLFPGLAADAAAGLCERLRRAVEGHPWSEIHPGLTVTLSVGLADDPVAPDHEALLSLADARLYAVKRGGKNRVEA